jgi:hypothetical protein
MTTSDQEDQAEKRRVTLQDVDVRQQQQTSTFHQHALSQADEISGGRFRATGVPSVTGSTPVPQYPQASTPFQRDPVPDEPALGYPIDAMPELESPTGAPLATSPVATDDPANAPSGDGGAATSSGGPMCERAGSSPSTDDGGFDDAA